jgi:predicted deacetylase
MKPALAQPGTDGALCLVLHDVAPARWRACRRVLDAVAAAAAASGQGLPPMTLLVVPQWHGDERCAAWRARAINSPCTAAPTATTSR